MRKLTSREPHLLQEGLDVAVSAFQRGIVAVGHAA
eukprot:CAMPEP_0118883924 /NCGR_PEP_ID=MMETSP1163-20130328/22896_1 /TAXON_ID=124430 /ORGANISM="Phaeomonas parva, Strain CCMP2877" /LENGTH=34 /DNA_ID= /DNA_START= /DNA_END= /DNA_ORIENTATION=